MNRPIFSFVVGGILLLATTVGAQTEPVTLAWDPSPDGDVAGYVVYVGSAPGSYQQQINVGLQTSFVYRSVSPGRWYYFAVAAYSAAMNIGDRSQEVSFLSAGVPSVRPSPAPLPPHSTPTPVPHSVARTPATEGVVEQAQTGAVWSSVGHDICAARGECYRADSLADVSGHVSAVTPAEDGRVFFLEDGRHVRVIDGDRPTPAPALSAASSAAFADLVLDPGFAQNRLVYVGVVRAARGGGRQLDVVRYREIAGTLGEGAVVVAGLPLPASGSPALAIDEARRLYVALPGSADSARVERYAGMVLRFESDGRSVPGDGADAPVFMSGYADPKTLVWSATRNELWLTGADANGTREILRTPLDPGASGVVTVEHLTIVAGFGAASLSLPSVVSGRVGAPDINDLALVFLSGDGGVFRVLASPAGLVAIPWPGQEALGGVITSVSSKDGSLYLALTTPASGASRILKLRPQ